MSKVFLKYDIETSKYISFNSPEFIADNECTMFFRTYRDILTHSKRLSKPDFSYFFEKLELYSSNEDIELFLIGFFEKFKQEISFFEKFSQNKFVLKYFYTQLSEKNYRNAFKLFFDLKCDIKHLNDMKLKDFFNLSNEEVFNLFLKHIHNICNQNKKTYSSFLNSISFKKDIYKTNVFDIVCVDDYLIDFFNKFVTEKLSFNFIKEDILNMFNRFCKNVFRQEDFLNYSTKEHFSNELFSSVYVFEQDKLYYVKQKFSSIKLSDILNEKQISFFNFFKQTHLYGQTYFTELDKLYVDYFNTFSFNLSNHIYNTYDTVLSKLDKDIKKIDISELKHYKVKSLFTEELLKKNPTMYNLQKQELLQFGSFNLLLIDLVSFYQKHNSFENYELDLYMWFHKNICSKNFNNTDNNRKFLNIFLILKHFGFEQDFFAILKNDKFSYSFPISLFFNIESVNNLLKIEKDIGYISFLEEIHYFKKNH